MKLNIRHSFRSRYNQGLIIPFIFFASCSAPSPEQGSADTKASAADLVNTPNHEKAIQTNLSMRHIDEQSDEITTHFEIWRQGKLVKTIERKDTIEALPPQMLTNEKDPTQPDIKAPDDYEFYITVK